MKLLLSVKRGLDHSASQPLQLWLQTGLNLPWDTGSHRSSVPAMVPSTPAAVLQGGKLYTAAVIFALLQSQGTIPLKVRQLLLRMD